MSKWQNMAIITPANVFIGVRKQSILILMKFVFTYSVTKTITHVVSWLVYLLNHS